VARALTQEGFRISAAADGKAMRKVLADSRIDLILLDLMLPGEDGLSLCRAWAMGIEWAPPALRCAVGAQSLMSGTGGLCAERVSLGPICLASWALLALWAQTPPPRSGGYIT
jgi:hypothetical protein